MSAKLTVSIPEWLDKICAWPMMAYRKHKYGYAYRRINLGEGEWTILDQEDYYRLNHFKWYLIGKNGKYYAAHNVKTNNSLVIQIRMHREIMKPPKDILIDHRNCDGLDNRRDNMRFATHTQNMHNCRKRKNATSRFIGVCFNKNRKLWDSSIMNNRKKMFLGRFKNEVEAAKAYDAAAKKYHGEFARLNFPEGNPVT